VYKRQAFDVSADRRYAGIAVPATESLKDTIARALPAYEALVVPELKAGRRVVIAAHGNSLRALVKHLSGLSDEEILHFEIPTGVPIVYTLGADLKATGRRFLEL
jgi:2,3-bisphosphoglycerate-dependent phosphoglycerate mutase